jgi:hypothetical protein
MISAI